MVVLILEPEAIVGLMLETELRHAGHAILGPVTTPDDALAAATTRRVDCALLTIQSSDTSAASLSEKLCVPAWIVCNDIEQAQHASKHALGYIIKPYEAETVIQAVNLTHEILADEFVPPARIPSGLELFRHRERSFSTDRIERSTKFSMRALRGPWRRGHLA
jgi:DNA-binding NarL/FixJ family response regulator